MSAPTASLSPADVYMAAAGAEHLARCARCRDIDAALDAAAAENAASIARRDRVQLSLRLRGTKAVTR